MAKFAMSWEQVRASLRNLAETERAQAEAFEGKGTIGGNYQTILHRNRQRAYETLHNALQHDERAMVEMTLDEMELFGLLPMGFRRSVAGE